MREERVRREQEAQEAARRKRLIGYVAGGVAVAAIVIAIIAIALAGGSDDEGAAKGGGTKEPAAFPEGSVPEAKPIALEDAAKAADCELKDPPNEGAKHVQGKVKYKANPPTSGDHFEVPADDGAYYDDPPPQEATVHALEHGRIHVQFKPDAPAEIKGNLFALFEEDESHMLLTPNQSNMDVEVAATAWDHQLLCPKMNDQVYDAIRAFKFRWRDKGPENVP